jgi:hypothetical protein
MSFTGTLSGGLIGETPNYAALAKKSEARRKGVIDLGLKQIGAVFDGGAAPFYSLANAGGSKFDPKSTYFFQDKKGGFVPYWAPKGAKPSGTYNYSGIGKALNTGGFDLAAMGVMKGLGLTKALGFGDEDSPKEIAMKAFRRGQLFNAPNEQTFTGFGPEFFQSRTKAYTDYAMPQVAEQYLDARNAQTYGLSNRGLLSSSLADQARSRLERTAGQSRQAVAEEGINQANTLKRNVETSRQNAINQLYQTADPARAFQSAISSASQLGVPSPFAPITNMFANLAQQYYTNQLLKGYQQGTQQLQNFNKGNNSIALYLAPLPD